MRRSLPDLRGLIDVRSGVADVHGAAGARADHVGRAAVEREDDGFGRLGNVVRIGSNLQVRHRGKVADGEGASADQRAVQVNVVIDAARGGAGGGEVDRQRAGDRTVAQTEIVPETGPNSLATDTVAEALISGLIFHAI